jgi:hypothetical protein
MTDLTVCTAFRIQTNIAGDVPFDLNADTHLNVLDSRFQSIGIVIHRCDYQTPSWAMGPSLPRQTVGGTNTSRRPAMPQTQPDRTFSGCDTKLVEAIRDAQSISDRSRRLAAVNAAHAEYLTCIATAFPETESFTKRHMDTITAVQEQLSPLLRSGGGGEPSVARSQTWTDPRGVIVYYSYNGVVSVYNSEKRPDMPADRIEVDVEGVLHQSISYWLTAPWAGWKLETDLISRGPAN